MWVLDLELRRIGKAAKRRIEIEGGGSELPAEYGSGIQSNFVALYQGSSVDLGRVPENDQAVVEVVA